MVDILAPAKLNLTLEVVAKRGDGFHEISSLIQTIDLCDCLRFQLGQGITISCDQPQWLPKKSLVSKAASLLQKTAKYPKGATIAINKHIPLLSGLGGDSSDAAATLRGLNKLWNLRLSLLQLLELAPSLGSDVAFFLYRGTALVRGRGEIVTPLPPLSPMWAVLLIPPVPRMPDKTKRLYVSLKASHYTNGQITDNLVSRLKRGRGITTSLFNVFDSVGDDSFTGLGEYRRQFLKAGAQWVHLAGSGPTLFTLTEDKTKAERVYQNLKPAGLECYLAETVTALDKVG